MPDGALPAPAGRAVAERVEAGFWRALFEGVDPVTRRAHGFVAAQDGPMSWTLVRDLAPARPLNLVFGAGLPGAAGTSLARALDAADDLGVSYNVSLTPGLPEHDAAAAQLVAAGLEPGYPWMKFVRDAAAPVQHEPPPGVEVVPVATAADSELLGRIICEPFGIPAWFGATVATCHEHDRLHGFLALVDGEPAGCGLLYVEADGVHGCLGAGATLPHARGRGCQGAVIAARIAFARELGVQRLFVETGAAGDGGPGASYRNILRAGFREAYVRANWTRPG